MDQQTTPANTAPSPAATPKDAQATPQVDRLTILEGRIRRIEDFFGPRHPDLLAPAPATK